MLIISILVVRLFQVSKKSTNRAWLSIIGIGENGVAGLCEQARRLIAAADVVYGGARHLELAAELVGGEAKIWQNPLENSINEILSLAPSSQSLTPKICVLASGDPFCYGIGATLARHIPVQEMLVIPAPSCFSLAAARLGWALQDIVTIGLNARALENIIPHLQPNAKILALSTDETTPKLLAELLEKKGFAEAKMWVLEHLGGDKENIIFYQSSNHPIIQSSSFARLNMIALEIPAHLTKQALPLASGLPDDLFEHDGQLTKREIRAITLSALAPRRGELLWDIGLGAGSVAIEWLLSHPANRAIGFEKNPERAARAGQNAKNLGVPHLQIIEGSAPEILANAEAPDAVFIGGGGGNLAVIEAAYNALKNGGRLVVNAVTLETESQLIAAHKKYGGNIIRIGIDRAEDVGSMTGLRPAMRVMQWSAIKKDLAK